MIGAVLGGCVGAAGVVVDGGGVVVGIVEGEAAGDWALAMPRVRQRQMKVRAHKSKAIFVDLIIDW